MKLQGKLAPARWVQRLVVVSLLLGAGSQAIQESRVMVPTYGLTMLLGVGILAYDAGTVLFAREPRFGVDDGQVRCAFSWFLSRRSVDRSEVVEVLVQPARRMIYIRRWDSKALTFSTLWLKLDAEGRPDAVEFAERLAKLLGVPWQPVPFFYKPGASPSP